MAVEENRKLRVKLEQARKVLAKHGVNLRKEVKLLTSEDGDPGENAIQAKVLSLDIPVRRLPRVHDGKHHVATFTDMPHNTVWSSPNSIPETVAAAAATEVPESSVLPEDTEPAVAKIHSVIHKVGCETYLNLHRYMAVCSDCGKFDLRIPARITSEQGTTTTDSERDHQFAKIETVSFCRDAERAEVAVGSVGEELNLDSVSVDPVDIVGSKRETRDSNTNTLAESLLDIVTEVVEESAVAPEFAIRTESPAERIRMEPQLADVLAEETPPACGNNSRSAVEIDTISEEGEEEGEEDEEKEEERETRKTVGATSEFGTGEPESEQVPYLDIEPGDFCKLELSNSFK